MEAPFDEARAKPHRGSERRHSCDSTSQVHRKLLITTTTSFPKIASHSECGQACDAMTIALSNEQHSDHSRDSDPTDNSASTTSFHHDSNKPTLYHVKRTISSPIVQLILELGLTTIHIQEISFVDLKSPEYLQINPMGTSPAFQDGEIVLWESGAIIDYLLETYDLHHALSPVAGRPRYLQLKQYLIATVYPMVASWFLKQSLGNNDRARDMFRTVIGPYLERVLGTGPYFLGDQRTIVDFIAAKPFMNLHSMGELSRFPTLQAHWERISALDSYKQAYEGLNTSIADNDTAAPLDCASSVQAKKQRLMHWTTIQPNAIA